MIGSLAADGAAEAFPGGDGFFAGVEFVVPPDSVGLLLLHGEAVVTAGTTVDRIIAGLEWAAQTVAAGGASSNWKTLPVNGAPQSTGRLTWTYQDGRALARVLVGTGRFRFGAYRTAAPPAGVTAAIARVRGVLLPASTPPEEQVRVLALMGGG